MTKKQQKRLALIIAALFTAILFTHAYRLYSSSSLHRLAITRKDIHFSSEPPTLGDGRYSLDENKPSRSLEEIYETVSSTNGFYVRDWSLWLGWNNMRYIIEASLLQAEILNRTLVLPSFIYARGCELDIEYCAVQFDMVNKNDVLHRNQWRNLPIEMQMAWRVPISMMLDLHLLRKRQPVILVSEYLRLHSLSESVESSIGAWERWSYHTGSNVFAGGDSEKNSNPSLYVVHNDWFDNDNIIRVDKLPEYVKDYVDWDHDTSVEGKSTSRTAVYEKLMRELNKKRIMSWSDARRVLKKLGLRVETDDELQSALQENGWATVYTYETPIMMKTVTLPIRQVVPRFYMRGFKDDYYLVEEDVLLLEGETHVLPDAAPGDLRFTSPEARTDFTRTVLQYVKPPPKVLEQAEVLGRRMSEIVEGRVWMAAHMRREDFVRSHWISTRSITSHLNLVRSRLEAGLEIISDIRNNSLPMTYDIPDVVLDPTSETISLPRNGDPFYVATDERSSIDLDYLTEHGAILLSDLLTTTDRRAFGPSIWLTDVLGLIEQAFLSQAAYFYGSEKSSFTGGVFNMRAARGADPRTSLAD